MRNVRSFSLTSDSLGDTARGLAADLDEERTAWNVLVRKLDVYNVVPWFRGAVCHSTRSVFVVLAFDVSLGRPLDREAQASIPSISGVNHEFIQLVGHSLNETTPTDLDL